MRIKTKHVVCAFLLAAALMVAPTGNAASMSGVVTASSNNENAALPGTRVAVSLDGPASQAISSCEASTVGGKAVGIIVSIPDGNVEAATTGTQLTFNLDLADGTHSNGGTVYIRMAVPSNLYVGDMTVLHYLNGLDEEPEYLATQDNGDGTFTFAVTSFSTFKVVAGHYDAEHPYGVESETEESDSSDDDANNNETSSDAAAAENTKAAQGAKDSVPKTGDSTVPVVPFALVGAACAAAAYGLKKREQA